MIDNAHPSDYEQFTFPDLVEITGYLWIYRVSGLTTLAKLFPNLRVIRGSEFVQAYSLIIWEAQDMTDIGLPSLTHIGAGHVRIEKNPQLCYTDTIAWHHIVQAAKNDTAHKYDVIKRNSDICVDQCPLDCPAAPVSHNTKTKYTCWNQDHCQKGRYISLHSFIKSQLPPTSKTRNLSRAW